MFHVIVDGLYAKIVDEYIHEFECMHHEYLGILACPIKKDIELYLFDKDGYRR